MSSCLSGTRFFLDSSASKCLQMNERLPLASLMVTWSEGKRAGQVVRHTVCVCVCFSTFSLLPFFIISSSISLVYCLNSSGWQTCCLSLARSLVQWPSSIFGHLFLSLAPYSYTVYACCRGQLTVTLCWRGGLAGGYVWLYSHSPFLSLSAAAAFRKKVEGAGYIIGFQRNGQAKLSALTKTSSKWNTKCVCAIQRHQINST